MEGVIPPGELQSDSSNNTIIENNVEHWEYGISLSDCSNNTILINNITYLGLWIGKIEDSTGVSLYRSFNNMIIKNNIEHNGEGVRLVDSSFNNITDNNLTENFYGILLQGSQVNSLIGNNVTHDPVTFEESNETSRTGFGILISSYYSNLLRNNTIAGYKYNFGVGSGYGYYFQDVDTSNTVDGKPIYFWSDRQSGQIPSDAGYVAIVNSTNIIVEGLDLKNNYQGILIAYCNDTIIRQNNVANNDYGIWLDSSSNNTIYHNNFTDNGQHAYIDGEYGAGVNVWDDGYPSGGNRWSDYTGTDFYCGPHQNLTGSDGIGDTPYVIDENNQDTYPLGVFSAHLLGDLNLDGAVDILDAVQAASAFGSYLGHPNWNSKADLNHDNEVDIFDIIILANNFGRSARSSSPWLGASGTDMTYEIAQAMNTDITYGWLITQVTNGGSAETAGLRGGTNQVQIDGKTVTIGGDIVVGINGTRITNRDDLSTYLEEYTLPGETIVVDLVRSNQILTLSVQLQAQP
jgi:parallel beta-helix repeat protein